MTLTKVLVEQFFYKQLEELLLHSSLVQPLLPSELHTKLLLEVIRIVLGVDLQLVGGGEERGRQGREGEEWEGGGIEETEERDGTGREGRDGSHLTHYLSTLILWGVPHADTHPPLPLPPIHTPHIPV